MPISRCRGENLWHPDPGSYADYALSVPTAVQLILSVIVTAGISVALVWLFHGQIVSLAQEPEKDETDSSPSPPAAHHLSGRIIQVTSLGFVFLFGFTVSQFIGGYRDADAATHEEAQYYYRAMAAASQLPAAVGRDDLVASLESYGSVVANDEWPLMERADALSAYSLQSSAAAEVTAALGRSLSLGADQSPLWSTLTGSVDDMFMSATDRLGAVPSPNAVGLLGVTIFLGVVSLAMTTIFQPTRRRLNIVLIAVMAAVYGVLFFVAVELSNPFQGGSAITPLIGVVVP